MTQATTRQILETKSRTYHRSSTTGFPIVENESLLDMGTDTRQYLVDYPALSGFSSVAIAVVSDATGATNVGVVTVNMALDPFQNNPERFNAVPSSPISVQTGANKVTLIHPALADAVIDDMQIRNMVWLSGPLSPFVIEVSFAVANPSGAISIYLLGSAD